MKEQKLELMRRYLSTSEVRRKIAEEMANWRSAIQVTIGRAASLLRLSENQLRDWEEHGLLQPTRLANHRQYSLEDLDKLIVIRELINAKFAPGDIPPNIDEIANVKELRIGLNASSEQIQPIGNNLPIDLYVEYAKDERWWRFLASCILRMALLLIGEAVLPRATIGILLPFVDGTTFNEGGFSGIEVSLIGWLSADGSTRVFLTARPSFHYPTDYYLYPLVPLKNGEALASPKDDTVLILERKDIRSRSLSLSEATVDLIRRLLAPLYEERQKIQKCFGSGMRDEYIAAMKLQTTSEQDMLLEGIANMVIRWGGRSLAQRNRWRFCTILLPDLRSGELLPRRQQNLMVYAQSYDSPYIAGSTIFSALKSNTSLSIRAYQGGYIVYRPALSRMDVTSTAGEGPVRSCIAVPVAAEQGRSQAVLYVVSDEFAAFSEQDQQLLRIVGRFIENIFNTYQVHKREGENLRGLMRTHKVVDPFFKDFLTENDFMSDVEKMLLTINGEKIDGEWLSLQEQSKMLSTVSVDDDQEILSFIGLDLDDQQSLTNKYGDQIMRQLSKALGLHLQKLIVSLITLSTNCRLYYMYNGRFYIVLQKIPLERAQEKAEILRINIGGNILLEDTSLIVPDITVRLGVTSYKRTKLKELLQRYGSAVDVCAKLSQDLDTVLKMGMDEGGNIVISWEPMTKGFMRLDSIKHNHHSM